MSLYISAFRCNQGNHEDIDECCNSTQPCGEGQGDCDEYCDCVDDLVCGTRNCDKSRFPSNETECCEKPVGNYYIYKHTKMERFFFI